MDTNGELHVAGVLPPGKDTGTHFTGGSWAPGPALTYWRREKSFFLYRDPNPCPSCRYNTHYTDWAALAPVWGWLVNNNFWVGVVRSYRAL